MKIAILGAGLAGLSFAWHLLEKEGIEVVLFDPMGVGGKASRIAAGLLHPFGGMGAKKNPRADEGIQETLKLMEAAGVSLAPSGLLRLATLKKQLEEFAGTACMDGVEWWAQERVRAFDSRLIAHPGLYIGNAWSIDPAEYLEGLFRACKAKGARLVLERVEALSDLDGFDRVVLATGAARSPVRGIELPLVQLKGQMLEMEWDEAPLKAPVTGACYLLPKGNRVILGATFERDFSSDAADLAVAKDLLIPKGCELVRCIDERRVLGVRSALRAHGPGRRPVFGWLSERVFVLAGLGSKGLLYHGLYGKEGAERVRLGY